MECFISNWIFISHIWEGHLLRVEKYLKVPYLIVHIYNLLVNDRLKSCYRYRTFGKKEMIIIEKISIKKKDTVFRQALAVEISVDS